MTTKWQVQAAVLNSGLPAMSRLLMHTLLTRAHVETAVIAAQHSPSLSELARESGMGRSTVAKTLIALEEQRWIDRQAPAVADARKGARTRYRLLVGLGGSVPGVVHQGDQGSVPGGLPLVHDVDQGSVPGGRKRDPSCPSDPSDRSFAEPPTTHKPGSATAGEITAVRKAVFNATGKLVPDDHAVLIVRQLLADRPAVRNREAYLTGAIQRDKDPHRFLPTPMPPRYGAS